MMCTKRVMIFASSVVANRRISNTHRNTLYLHMLCRASADGGTRFEYYNNILFKKYYIKGFLR